MATTTVQTVNVSTIDEDGKQTTFNLDNPKDNLTKLQVVQAFQDGIDNAILMSNYGSLVKSVGTVTLATSTKIELEGDPIYVTPNSLTIAVNTNGEATSNVSVTNGTIQSAGMTNIQASSGGILNMLSFITAFNASQVAVRVKDAGSSLGAVYTGTLIIVIQGASYSVPVTVNIR